MNVEVELVKDIEQSLIKIRKAYIEGSKIEFPNENNSGIRDLISSLKSLGYIKRYKIIPNERKIRCQYIFTDIGIQAADHIIKNQEKQRKSRVYNWITILLSAITLIFTMISFFKSCK